MDAAGIASGQAFLGWITKEQVLESYEVLKKNQYGKYLKDVLDGKYVDKLHSLNQ